MKNLSNWKYLFFSALQLKNGNPGAVGHHSKAILEKLKKEMHNISEQRRNVVPLGKFHAPPGINTTGLQTDHIDIWFQLYINMPATQIF